MKHDLKIDIGYWLNRLRMEVHQGFEQRLQAYNITIAQWCILQALHSNNAASITELARYIETDKASISRVVDRLEQRKLLKHSRGADKRSGSIKLTPTGTALVPRLAQEARKNEQHFFGHLSTTDKEQLQRLFKKILTAIPSIETDGWLQ